jgi:hypothetical protein
MRAERALLLPRRTHPAAGRFLAASRLEPPPTRAGLAEGQRVVLIEGG